MCEEYQRLHVKRTGANASRLCTDLQHLPVQVLRYPLRAERERENLSEQIKEEWHGHALRGSTSASPSVRSTDERLTSIGQGAIVVSHFDFTGDGMDIPNNTLRAAKARRAEKEN